MDDLFKATDMSHLECIVRTILVLFRDENGSIVVESTDAIPSFVEGVQDSYNCQQLSVSPLSPFFKTLIEQLFDVASRNVNEEDVVNSSFAAVGSLCKSAPPNCKELVGEIPNTVVSFHSSFVASSLSSRGTVCDTNIANMVESIEMCIDRLDSAITPSSQRILDFTNDVLERGFGPLSQEASIRLISSLSGPCPSVIEPVFFQRLLNFFLNNLLQADEFDLFECTADSLGTISRNIRRESFNKALRPVMETINKVITNKDCCTLNHLRVVIILLADLSLSQGPYFLPFVPALLDLARAAAQSRIDPSDLDMCDDLADVQTAVLLLFNKLYESEGFDNIRQFGESHILPTLVT